MHLHVLLSRNLGEAFQILAFVKAMPKEFGAVHAARDYVMRDALQNDPSCSGHKVDFAIHCFVDGSPLMRVGNWPTFSRCRLQAHAGSVPTIRTGVGDGPCTIKPAARMVRRL